MSKIISPKGGEAWSVGSSHYIRWEGQPSADAAVKIEFTVDDGKMWSDVASAAPNDGKFLWQVPAGVSKDCRVRVTEARQGAKTESQANFSVIPTQEVSYRWTNLTMNAAFAPRDGAGALVYKGMMWFLGGWNPGDKKHFPRICNNEVWSSVDGRAWTLEKPNTFTAAPFDPESDWEGRHTAGYAAFKDKMWIVGGDANQGHYQFDVWNTSDGKTWTQVNKGRPVPWGPRVLHITVAFKDKIWVIGGQTLPQFAPARETIFHNDVWSTSDGVNWTKVEQVKPIEPPRGMIGFSAVFQDRIWILGGGTYDTPEFPDRNFYHDVWSTRDGERWERHEESAPWTPRQYHDVAVFDGRIWVMEGYHKGSGNRNDVWYSMDGVNWYEVPATPWKPRHAASVFVYDNGLWMVAGNNMESDVWKLQRR